MDQSALSALEELRQQGVRDRAARDAAEATLRRLLDVSLLGVCTCDLSGRVVEANDAFLRMLGSTREEVRGLSLDLIALAPQERREEALQARRRLMEDGELAPVEVELSRADGKKVPVLLAGTRLPSRSAVVLFAQDLSESRRKEAAIRSAEARLSLLLQAMPVMLFELGPDGMITFVDGAEQQGLPTAVGQSLFSRWAERPDVIALGRRALAGEALESQLEWRGRLFDLTLRPGPAPAGEKSLVLGAAVEVTDGARALEERRRLQEWLAQEHQLDGLGVLAAGLASAFNNLLAGVIANASSVSASLGSGHPGIGAIDDLLSSATRAAGLAQKVLQTAVPQPVEARPIELSSWLREMAPLLVAALPGRARLELELTHVLPLVQTHPDQLRRALIPLLTGAIEATRQQGGLIRIATRLIEIDGQGGELASGVILEPGWYVGISVIDDGETPGPAALAELRDPMGPIGAALPGSRALGLAAVISTLRAQRGGVRINVGQAGGTQIDLLYPASDLAATHRPLLAPRGPARSREILVVDDDPIILRAATRILQSAGLVSSTVKSGAEALERLRSGAVPGLVLLDFAMPGMNGEQTLRAMKQLQPELRVVLCSGYSEEEATWRIEPGLLSGFLPKPFTAQEMQAAVLRVLDGSGAADLQG